MFTFFYQDKKNDLKKKICKKKYSVIRFLSKIGTMFEDQHFMKNGLTMTIFLKLLQEDFRCFFFIFLQKNIECRGIYGRFYLRAHKYVNTESYKCIEINV